jgi:two-component system, OmpR family, response regulator QseB
MQPFDVGQAQRVRDMRHESYFLARGVDEDKAALGVQYRQRQPGKSRARSDIGNECPLKFRVYSQTVEEMMSDHILVLGDSGQVIGPVPSLELIQELLQTRGVGFRQLDTHTLCIVNETLDQAQGKGSPPVLLYLPQWVGLPNVRLLLVEDDAMIAEAIRTGLKRDGFTVDWVHDGESADKVLRTDAFDLLLLDLGLPRKSGLQVLQSLRARQQALPVLIITARDAVSDRVQGLDAGADDYLVKPFDLDELAARIRALLRRKSGRTEPEIEHLGVALNPATHKVTREGREIGLSPKEFSLLQLLMERPGNILSRAQIEERLYGWGEEVESNAVEVHIHGLRRKLGNDFILNVRGVGYRVRPAQ